VAEFTEPLRTGDDLPDGAHDRESDRAESRDHDRFPGVVSVGGRRKPTGVQQERSGEVAIATPRGRWRGTWLQAGSVSNAGSS